MTELLNFYACLIHILHTLTHIFPTLLPAVLHMNISFNRVYMLAILHYLLC